MARWAEPSRSILAGTPLRADFDGWPMVATVVDDAVRESLRAVSRTAPDRLVFPGCGTRAVPGTPRLETRHFVHRSGTGCSQHVGVGSEHLAARAVIVAAAIAAGRDAVPEQPGPGWVVYVLATRGLQRVVLEVQWSRQSRERYRERQRADTEAGVRTAWFVRHELRTCGAERELPAFTLEYVEDGFTIRGEDARLGLADANAVTGLLSGRLR